MTITKSDGHKNLSPMSSSLRPRSQQVLNTNTNVETANSETEKSISAPDDNTDTVPSVCDRLRSIDLSEDGAKSSGIITPLSTADPVHTKMCVSGSDVPEKHSEPGHISDRSRPVPLCDDKDKDVETFGDKDSYDIFKPKVIQLCHDIGYGEPTEVERMDGGGFNKIIGLAFQDPRERQCILRLPYEPYEDNLLHEVGDQVSVLLYLKQFDLNAPEVLAYDCTIQNAIKCQYVIQVRLPGSRIDEVYYDLPLAEKLQITELIAKMVIKMHKIKLPRPGRLMGERNLPMISRSPPSSPPSIKIGGYREYPVDTPPTYKEQDLVSLMLEICQSSADNPTASGKPRMYKKLTEIAHEMQAAGLMRTNDIQNVLWHWDFCARNILIEKQEVPIPTNEERSEDDFPDICGCQHEIKISIGKDATSSHESILKFVVKGSKENLWNHRVSFVREDDEARADTLDIENSGKELTAAQMKWTISGVLDWDDALAVPLVVANRPQSWLWFDESERDSAWTGDEDDKPDRKLAPEELLIKGTFDQIMAQEFPTYMDDAYGRGVWIRELTRFARDGFVDGDDWKRYDDFLIRWADYYKSLGLKGAEKSAAAVKDDTSDESGSDFGSEDEDELSGSSSDADDYESEEEDDENDGEGDESDEEDGESGEEDDESGGDHTNSEEDYDDGVEGDDASAEGGDGSEHVDKGGAQRVASTL